MAKITSVEKRKREEKTWRTIILTSSWLTVLILPAFFYINLLEVTSSISKLETKPIPYFVCILLTFLCNLLATVKEYEYFVVHKKSVNVFYGVVVLLSISSTTIVLASLCEMVEQLKHLPGSCEFSQALKTCNCFSSNWNIVLHIGDCNHIPFLKTKLYHACGALGYSMVIYCVLIIRFVSSESIVKEIFLKDSTLIVKHCHSPPPPYKV
ncbi:uncharacterized protein LOC105844537 isoform X3 [Hydra vulgaris]|uniref:Uncharacterized protein LOC105844537 isoform X3 n=1 Tax=Hydra vulgaris TaxID=6087 RepID=A0ABM4DAX6_HYDVU